MDNSLYSLHTQSKYPKSEMTDIKLLLKEARKLVDIQNFKEAQECCKSILRKDKNNYLALVLLGKSFEESEQASLAYQKAIACKPDQLLAWQGLANYYEVKNDLLCKTKLLDIYKEILHLNIDEVKTNEIITKLTNLGISLKSSEALSSLVRYYLKRHTENKINDVLIKHIIELLKADIPCKKEDIPIILEALYKFESVKSYDDVQLLIVQVILQKDDFGIAIEEIINLKFFIDNIMLREWLCKYLCMKYIETSCFSNISISQYLDKLTNKIETSKYAIMLNSMVHYDNSLYLEAYKLCVPLINYQQADYTEAKFILNCTLKLKKWSVTQKLATNFLTKTNDENLSLELKKFLFLSLVKQKKWNQAITASKDILHALNINELALLAESYISTKSDAADNLLKKLESTEHYIQLRALQLFNENKFNEAVTLLETATSKYSNFYLGRMYWELKEYEKSFMTLLKAAKCNPNHADNFLYLGHLYRYYKKDLEKAKKCYEKAFNLCDNDNDVIKSLSEVYSQLGLTDLDLNLLNKALITIQGNECWIQFRLGLHHLRKKDWDNAILNFRSVIKSDPTNINAFECLADSYYSRGSYTSALRAYNKVILLDHSKSSHCLTRVGYIYSVLTQYEEAISTFEKVLIIMPSSLLALKGIAETWMRIAKKKETAKMYGTARHCAQNAIDYVITALSLQKHYNCLWKLLADSLIFITKLPEIYVYVYMKLFNDLSTEKKRLVKIDIYYQAIACYSHIAKQKHEFASYDLAFTYLAMYAETGKVSHCHTSFNIVLSCIKRKPSVWQNWNFLGKICQFIKKYDLAQHCFIKALHVTRKWSIAQIWCNLGSLYLKLKLHKLANYCFWRGQSTLPSYSHSWIGQALIAEVIQEEEAMDLFRHASRLGYHPESALGYADWVCRTLEKKGCKEFKYVIDGLYAVQHATDLMEWFTTFEPNNPYACTMLGILQERSGLLQSAYKSYEKALKYIGNNKINIALINMGRMLIRMEKYDEAIKVYKSVTEACLNSACGLALALYKKGLYEEAYTAYDTALQWLCNGDLEKADLLVAMAGIVYMFKGQDDAKMLLFHSIQVSQIKPTAHSLFAICSMGYINSDKSLSKLALSEMKKYNTDSTVAFDIGFLKSYLPVCEENINEAIKILGNTIHNHPSNATLWFYIAQYCLTVNNGMPKLSSSCAKRALHTTTFCNNDCNHAKMLATASIAERLSGDHVKSLILAKKGLHMYPNEAVTWAALLFSLLPQKIWIERKDWLLLAVAHMRRHLNITRTLSRWLSLVEKKLSN